MTRTDFRQGFFFCVSVDVGSVMIVEDWTDHHVVEFAGIVLSLAAQQEPDQSRQQRQSHDTANDTSDDGSRVYSGNAATVVAKEGFLVRISNQTSLRSTAGTGPTRRTASTGTTGPAVATLCDGRHLGRPITKRPSHRPIEIDPPNKTRRKHPHRFVIGISNTQKCPRHAPDTDNVLPPET
jgi:hypothetical protein